MNYLLRIRELREDGDYKQREIAALLHVGQKTYSDYELGKTRIPLDSMLILSEFYNVDMNYLCGLTNDKRPFNRTNDSPNNS